MGELWKTIKDYENYEVSTYGNVRNKRTLKVLKPRNHLGYARVAFYRGGKQFNYGVHRLVAQAFLDNPEGHPVVRHLDDVRDNNLVSNLAWGTYRDNTMDSVRNNKHHYSTVTACPKGHPYSGDNLFYNTAGGRRCRECSRASSRRT